MTVFRGPGALKVHFRFIYDGLLFRRFRSQVPGDPKKIRGGVRELLGPVSAKNHPAPGVALAVLLTTFPAFRPELEGGPANRCL